jgi:hypothetical protein
MHAPGVPVTAANSPWAAALESDLLLLEVRRQLGGVTVLLARGVGVFVERCGWTAFDFIRLDNHAREMQSPSWEMLWHLGMAPSPLAW